MLMTVCVHCSWLTNNGGVYDNQFVIVIVGRITNDGGGYGSVCSLLLGIIHDNRGVYCN